MDCFDTTGNPSSPRMIEFEWLELTGKTETHICENVFGFWIRRNQSQPSTYSIKADIRGCQMQICHISSIVILSVLERGDKKR